MPAIKDKRDRPIVSYVGDTVVLECGIKRIPNTWEWYKTNGSEKVKYCTFTLYMYITYIQYSTILQNLDPILNNKLVTNGIQ